jgi:hypothetical protein
METQAYEAELRTRVKKADCARKEAEQRIRELQEVVNAMAGA